MRSVVGVGSEYLTRASTVPGYPSSPSGLRSASESDVGVCSSQNHSCHVESVPQVGQCVQKVVGFACVRLRGACLLVEALGAAVQMIGTVVNGRQLEFLSIQTELALGNTIGVTALWDESGC